MNTVAQHLINTLVKLKIKYIFGVPSGNFIDYMDIIHQTPDIEFVLVTNEASGAFMADVYWRLTKKLAACFGTFGPGACNLSTGVCGGFLDRSPMLAFTDEASDKMKNRVTQMNIDHQQLFKPITKWTTRLIADSVESILEKAYQIAVAEIPGPVHIGLPAGIGPKKVTQINTKTKIAETEHTRLKYKEVPISIKGLLKKAQKPLIVIGNSANRYQIKKTIIQLAEHFSAPVVLTPMAKGQFPESHQLYGGVLGHALNNQVAKIYNQADLIIAIGYDPVEINFEDWCPTVPIIDINTTDQFICDQNFPGLKKMIGDMDGSIDSLCNLQTMAFKWDKIQINDNKKEIFRQLKLKTSHLNVSEALDIIREELPEDGIMTCDVGAHLHLIGQKWLTPKPELQLMTNGCSSMGFAIPAAIAAKIARNNQKVCCITGDGGFAMMAGEVLTALRLKLAIVFIVLVDETLSLIRIKQKNKKFIETDTSLTENHASSNCYFGIPAQYVENRNDLQSILKDSLNTDRPQIIEIKINSADYNVLVLNS